MKITHLKTNHLVNPLGYLMDAPVFTFQVEDAVGKRQTAARIRVSETPDMTAPLYDTGFSSKVSSLAHQAEIPLKPRTRYYWQAAVQTDAGEEAESAIQWFETAKMDEAWQAKWISCDSLEARHPVFEKALAAQSGLVSARLYLCGLGLYEASLNGERIGHEYFTPYSNNYQKWLQYQTFDITDAMRKGGLLSVSLGNGWYKGRFGFTSPPDGAGFYGDSWKLIAEIRLTYQDGSEKVIGTDESWQVTRSDITFSNLYDGEHADATLPPLPPVPALPCGAPAAPLTARLSTAATVHERLKPIALLHTPANETVLDIGQNLAGIFELSVHVPRGQTVHLWFGEVLQSGCFYRDNLRSAKAEYSWVSDGQPHVLMPRFTFFGFRYVKVEGVKNLQKDDFTALALYSDIAPLGDIVTGHALVNKLIQNTRWGQKGNYLDVPTDCPQRDERMGWTGDAQVFSPTAAYLTDCYAFMRKYLYDMGQEQLEHNGKVPDVVPSAGLTGVACGWGDACCIIPWNMYVFYGDDAILKEHYPHMRSWVDYLQRLDGDTHEWGKRFHYGDWLALDLPGLKPDTTRGGTDESFIANAYFRHSAVLTAKAARVLGKTADEEKYLRLADKLLSYIQSEYFSPAGRCCVDTQTAHVLTLYLGLIDDKARPKQALDRLFELSDGQLRTGFIGTPLLCNVLTDVGDAKRAYQLLLNEDYPGWLHEIKLGATTVWERWNSVNDDGSISSTGMNSLNHYAYGSIVEWLFRHAAGIAPAENAPGFQRAVLKPQISRELGFLNASYRSAAGLYELSWKVLDENHVEVAVTVPFNCTAELHLPFAPKGACPKCAVYKNGGCELQSGSYRMVYETTQRI